MQALLTCVLKGVKMITHINLSSVLNALVTVIIRYHDYQKVNKIVEKPSPEDTHEKAKEFIKELDAAALKDKLTAYINECTDASGYNIRKSFLNFLVMQIDYLKPIIETERALESTEINQITARLKQLIIDSIELLKTTKDKTYKVTWTKDCKIDINGLSNNAYYVITLCNSGQLLLDELFTPLKLCRESTPSEIESTIEQLVQEFNLPFLAKETLVLRKENEGLKSSCYNKDIEIALLKQELAELKEKFAEKSLAKEANDDVDESNNTEPPKRAQMNTGSPYFFGAAAPVSSAMFGLFTQNQRGCNF